MAHLSDLSTVLGIPPQCCFAGAVGILYAREPLLDHAQGFCVLKHGFSGAVSQESRAGSIVSVHKFLICHGNFASTVEIAVIIVLDCSALAISNIVCV